MTINTPTTEYLRVLKNRVAMSDNLTDIAKARMTKLINIDEAVVNVLGTRGIAGFKFHLPRREEIQMSSEITDHYTESNTPVQDHIARKPIIITLTGFQGEYFYSPTILGKLDSVLSSIVPTQQLITSYLPEFTDSAKQAKLFYLKAKETYVQNKQGGLKSAVTKTWNDMNFNAVDLWKTASDAWKLTSAQTRAFLYFKYLWESNSLFTVETTWARFDDMAILEVRPLRDENADITDFSIKLKQINRVRTLIKNVGGSVVNKGVDKGEEVPA